MTDASSTPADQLRAAAELLREAAGHATPGPWRTHDTHLGGVGGHTATVLTDRPNLNDTELIAWLPTMSHEPWDEARNAWRNAGWMALMDPGVGLALAVWLDRAADASDHHPTGEGGAVATVVHPALAVARQLLDGAPAPAVWADGDPLMEAIAAGVYEQCGTDPVSSIVVDDPRNIAAVAAAVARQLLGTTVDEGATAVLEPQDHPGADLFVALQHAGLDADEANRRMYAYARMVLRQEKATAAPPAPADRASVIDEVATALEKRHTELINYAAEHASDALEDRAQEWAWAAATVRALADGAAAGVQPPTTGEALTDAERQFLTFAMDLAFDEMVSNDGFTDEDHAALDKFRALATSPAAPAAPEETQ
ncbi:hypothetical protein ACWD7M_34320 [Streptomyces griseus]